MTKILITSLIDDLDGSPAQETVRFGFDGASYEIDLNDNHANELRIALATYVAAARKVTTARGRRGRALSDAGPTTAQVRAWARKQGILVNGRGAIQAGIMEKYLASH